MGSRSVILLDTHAWIGWIERDGRLSEKASAWINESETIGIASISCWEVAMLVQKNRVTLTQPIADWLDAASTISGVHLLSLTPSIAAISCDPALLGKHHDPSDRLIAATALLYDIPLITKDQRLRNLPSLNTIW